MKVAVIGLGFMGSTHLQAYLYTPGAEVVAVCSADPVQLSGDLSAVQGNLGRPGEKMDFSRFRKYRNPEDAIRDSEVEAVDLCLPTHLHAPLAIEALNRGKHVLVEKPMALTGSDADLMLEAARHSGRVLMVAQVLRFSPAYAVLGQRLPELGPLRAATFRRRCAAPGWAGWQGDPAQSGGALLDLLIHDLDLCLSLFGQPEAVSATGYQDLSRGIDCALAHLHYPGIASVAVSGGWHHPKAFPFSSDYTVVADGGTLDYSSTSGSPVLYRADGEAELLPLPEIDGYAAEVKYFVDCCNAGRRAELCPPEESAAAVKLARRILESRERQGERLSFKA